MMNCYADTFFLQDQDREKLFESKLQQIQEAESAIIEAAIRRDNAGAKFVFLHFLWNYMIFIHIYFENCKEIINPGHPFCSGITLSKLSAVTTDEQGNETFDTSGALDKLRKFDFKPTWLNQFNYEHV
ncbi:hypothetical protein MA16_Dca013254 [Dendrobium catenatum]|uniref:Uncharacterized protein n=1 Tax=Dendrobium catenatum TaxID=906689 RepID=A0A2I0WNJ0_9ASPA|nr:hypothetical protein MA16_Dca013254 [Dendrobium catenatum]